MVSIAQGNGLFVHHSDGYNKLSLAQQGLMKHVIPHVKAATESLNNTRDEVSFVVVDYGAADGLNSVPMIAACAGELSSQVSEYKWIFNDLFDFDNVRRIEEQLNGLPGWEEGSVKLHYVVGSFFTQVVPENSVDLGVSVTAVHFLSQRPPNGSNKDFRYPDETTKAISAKDWLNFLHLRAKELKNGGRLVVGAISIGDGSPLADTETEFVMLAVQHNILEMFKEGIITEEEYEYARVYPYCCRTEAELRAPFLHPESEICQTLQLINITTYHAPCPLHHMWMAAGGRESASATEDYVSGLVDFTKSSCNSLWKLLEVTRSKDERVSIMETFYRKAKEYIRHNPEAFHAGMSLSVVDMVKL